MCYVIDSKLNRQENMEVPNDAIYHLLEVLKENKDSLVNGISYQEAIQILEYVVNKTWNNLAHFGIDLSRNSLNGFVNLHNLVVFCH